MLDWVLYVTTKGGYNGSLFDYYIFDYLFAHTGVGFKLRSSPSTSKEMSMSINEYFEKIQEELVVQENACCNCDECPHRHYCLTARLGSICNN